MSIFDWIPTSEEERCLPYSERLLRAQSAVPLAASSHVTVARATRCKGIQHLYAELNKLEKQQRQQQQQQQQRQQHNHRLPTSKVTREVEGVDVRAQGPKLLLHKEAKYVPQGREHRLYFKVCCC